MAGGLPTPSGLRGLDAARAGQAQASDRQPWIWSTHCWADGTSWAQKL